MVYLFLVCCPGLSGVELLMSDLKALETYASYFYQSSKIWSKPLPEAYDPQDVAHYFNARPHVVALRMLEVIGLMISTKTCYVSIHESTLFLQK